MHLVFWERVSLQVLSPSVQTCFLQTVSRDARVSDLLVYGHVNCYGSAAVNRK